MKRKRGEIFDNGLYDGYRFRRNVLHCYFVVEKPVSVNFGEENHGASAGRSQRIVIIRKQL